jgi:hypothetical protein
VENKAIDFVIDGGKLKIMVDPNKDGQKLMVLELDLAEVPDEVIAAIK